MKPVGQFASQNYRMETQESAVQVTGSRVLHDLQPVSRSSLSGEIVEQIVDLISREVLKSGERLPAERELCKRFGVGRTSLREALRSLTMMGVLDGQVGKGTFVCSNRNYLDRTLQWGFLFDRKTVQDLEETRLMLETQAAFLSAERARPVDLEDIEVAFEGMENSTGQLESFLEYDLQYHMLIARATQNSIIGTLSRMTRGYLKEWIKSVLADPSAAEVQKRVQLTLLQHRRILDALKSGTPEEAREAMSQHIISSSVDVRKHL